MQTREQHENLRSTRGAQEEHERNTRGVQAREEHEGIANMMRGMFTLNLALTLTLMCVCVCECDCAVCLCCVFVLCVCSCVCVVTVFVFVEITLKTKMCIKKNGGAKFKMISSKETLNGIGQGAIGSLWVRTNLFLQILCFPGVSVSPLLAALFDMTTNN